jgi:hypothetical protein
MSCASAVAAAVPNYGVMGPSQSWDRKSFRSGEESAICIQTRIFVLTSDPGWKAFVAQVRPFLTTS